MTNFVGVDFSMTSPAICVHPDQDEWDDSQCIIYNKSTFTNDSFQIEWGPYLDFEKMISTSATESHKRYEEIRQWALTCIPEDSFIMFEDYAMGAKGKVFNIAENTGITKHSLILRGDIVETIAPTSLKKWASGRGNAKKEDMVDRFHAITGVDLPLLLDQTPDKSPCSDIVDAYFVCRYFFTTANNSV